MPLVTILPGGRAATHRRLGHETAIDVLRGEAEMWCGDELQERLTVRAGEFLSIPAGMPHLPANPGLTEPCVAVRARTDSAEQESVVLLTKVIG